MTGMTIASIIASESNRILRSASPTGPTGSSSARPQAPKDASAARALSPIATRVALCTLTEDGIRTRPSNGPECPLTLQRRSEIVCLRLPPAKAAPDGEAGADRERGHGQDTVELGSEADEVQPDGEGCEHQNCRGEQ